jgi:hypothetical protein
MNDNIKTLSNNSSFMDQKQSQCRTMLSLSALLTVESINNDAVIKLQKGNYIEARKIFVSALDILRDCHTIQIQQQQQYEQLPQENEETAVTSVKAASLIATETSVSTTSSTPCSCFTAAISATNPVESKKRCCGEGIVSVPIGRERRHFQRITDENDECMEFVKDDEEFCTEQLSQCEYYNAVFVLPSAATTSTECTPDYCDVLAVLMFNIALTYQKEGINGRSASFRKAIYLYRRATTIIRRSNMLEIDDNTQQSLLVVVLASFHNLGFIYKELGQPSLFRNILEAGIIIERKLNTINTDSTSNMPKLQPHDRQFFAMNRFFSRYSEHACAQAA